MRKLVFVSGGARTGRWSWAVCRRVLGDRHAAEAAFQATLLVLAAQGRLRSHAASSWRTGLHGVAVPARRSTPGRGPIAALKARGTRHRRCSRSAVSRPTGAGRRAGRGERRAILDEELARLPARVPRRRWSSRELDRPGRAAPGGRPAARYPRRHPFQPPRAGQGPCCAIGRPGGDWALSAVALEAVLRKRSPRPSSSRPRWRVRSSRPRCASRPVPPWPRSHRPRSATLTQGVPKAMLSRNSRESSFGWPPLPSSPRASACSLSRSPIVAPRSDGPSPGALEKKLDRILEALGGSARNMRHSEAGNESRSRLTNPNEPSYPRHPSRGPGPRWHHRSTQGPIRGRTQGRVPSGWLRWNAESPGRTRGRLGAATRGSRASIQRHGTTARDAQSRAIRGAASACRDGSDATPRTARVTLRSKPPRPSPRRPGES